MSPDATRGTYACFSSSDPQFSTGVIPSLEMRMASAVEAQTRASSSVMMATVTVSAPAPPYAAGMPSAGSSISLQASNDFQGNSALRSASAALGATFSSQKERRVWRKSRCTSVRAKLESLTPPFSQAPRPGGSPVPGSPSVGVEVPDQKARQLDRCHLGDPVRHVVEDLEGVRTLHELGRVLGGRPPEGGVPGGPAI